MRSNLAPSDITAVIFDCDGVLIDSEVLSLEVEHTMLGEIGLVYEMADYKRRFLGLSYRAYIDIVSAEVLERTGRPLPADFDKQFGARLRGVWEERLMAITGASELVGALELPKAVASSSILRSLEWKLRKTNLIEPFGAHIYSTEHVTNGKPAPDLFLFAAAKLKARPSTTLVIEDAINGILAAKAAGMVAAGFTGGSHCAEGHAETLLAAGADMLFGSHAELAAYFGGVAG